MEGNACAEPIGPKLVLSRELIFSGAVKMAQVSCGRP